MVMRIWRLACVAGLSRRSPPPLSPKMGKESKKVADPDGLSKEERAELDFIQFKVLF